MIKVLVLGVLAAAILPAAEASAAGGGPSSACASINVGYRVVKFGNVNVSVWYPTAATASSYTYSQLLTGVAAENGALATCDTFPLILFSHGLNGCATQSIFLTEPLARAGYIVASPDYRDAKCSSQTSQTQQSIDTAPFKDPASWSENNYIDRRDDTRVVLDGMLAHAEFGPRIDKDRIAGVGHSLGGYTIGAMIGGWPSWYEARFKAAVLMSPWMEPFNVPGRVTLNNIKIPVMMQGGTADIGITPGLKKEGGIYDTHPVPKFFGELRRATHFEWTNFVCGRTPTTVSNCATNDANAKLIVDYTIDFLEQFIRSQNKDRLFSGNAQLAEYRRETMVSSLSTASYAVGRPLAPESWGSGFGLALAPRLIAATEAPLPTTLGGIAVQVTDSRGTTLPARLAFVSPTQVNYLVPERAATGTAKVVIRQNNEVVSSGTIQIEAVAPGFFTANAQGTGLAAAETLRVFGDGRREGGFVASGAIDLEGGDVFIVLYGTGLRGSSAGSTTVTVAGESVPILGLAPSPQYAGLDQLAIGPLPSSLRGKGQVDVVVTMSGQRANTITLNIR